jgi:hypothetical protein
MCFLPAEVIELFKPTPVFYDGGSPPKNEFFFEDFLAEF